MNIYETSSQYLWFQTFGAGEVDESWDESLHESSVKSHAPVKREWELTSHWYLWQAQRAQTLINSQQSVKQFKVDESWWELAVKRKRELQLSWFHKLRNFLLFSKDSTWMVIVTMTTLGYGDVVPVTLIGRFVAGLMSVLGIFLMALLISVIHETLQLSQSEKRILAHLENAGR